MPRQPQTRALVGPLPLIQPKPLMMPNTISPFSTALRSGSWELAAQQDISSRQIHFSPARCELDINDGVGPGPRATGCSPVRTRFRRSWRSIALSVRSFSPTALQSYAKCPYRFFLHAIHGFAPREVPEAIDELDPLQRGSLIHEVQFDLFARLRNDGLLPVRPSKLREAQERLDVIIAEIAARYRDVLRPPSIASGRMALPQFGRIFANGYGGRARTSPATFPGSSNFRLGWSKGRERHQADLHGVPGGGRSRLRHSASRLNRPHRAPSFRNCTRHGSQNRESGRQAKPINCGRQDTLTPALCSRCGKVARRPGQSYIGSTLFLHSAGGFAERIVPLDGEARTVG